MLPFLRIRGLCCSIFCLILLHPVSSFAQETGNPPDTVLPDSMAMEEPEFEFDFSADVGMSRIENAEGKREQFFATAIMPQFYYGKYSGGLFLRSHVHLKDRSFRKEDYDSFGDILSIIHFFQYSEKGEPGYYVRFGELDGTTQGFGQFINLFQNSISLDNQKRGIEFNYRSDEFVAEALISNAIAAEVFGLRGAYYPLSQDPYSKYKLVSVGVSLAGDMSNKGTLINEEVPGAPFLIESLTDSSGVRTAVGKDDGKIMMGGLDVSLPIFMTPTSSGLAYGEISKIFGHGMGLGAGVSADWKFPDDLRLRLQLEQRFMGKNYVPNYFNSPYEALRLQSIGIPVDGGESLEALNTRRNLLTAQDKRRLGSYFLMHWTWKRAWRFIWSAEHSWNVKNSAWIHVDIRVKSPEFPVYVRLVFDQIKAEKLNDIATTGNNLNFFKFEGAVRVFRVLMLGIGVKNSFEADFHDGVPIGLKKRRRIEPKFIISIPKKKKG